MRFIKNVGKRLVCSVLERQVKQLRALHDFKVVAVAGSVGKTSTKLAVAGLLAESFRVRHQLGNYNDRLTVPLIFFGHDEPNILNVFAWFKIFRANARAIHSEYPYDIVVIELGTDGPGFMRQFAYTQPDVAVLTAVAPEHMEFFGTLDAVAAEELVLFDYSKHVLVNVDDVDAKYLSGRQYQGYSVTQQSAAYFASLTDDGLLGQLMDVTMPSGELRTKTRFVGTQGAKIALAAVAVAETLGLAKDDIDLDVQRLQAFAGRMQILAGVQGSTIIDDTYNASPAAVTAALDVLYAGVAPQHIALLGNMNELGDFSAEAHTDIGNYCDPTKLDAVITLGPDANTYLAPAAQARGCNVKVCTSPYEAGEYIQSILKPGAYVLVKGSQNRVFAEETVKMLLADPADAKHLVRQSKHWQKVKRAQFGEPPQPQPVEQPTQA